MSLELRKVTWRLHPSCGHSATRLAGNMKSERQTRNRKEGARGTLAGGATERGHFKEGGMEDSAGKGGQIWPVLRNPKACLIAQ